MGKQKSIEKRLEERLPEDEDYTVEYEWVALSQAVNKRDRFVLVTFSSPLEEMYEDMRPPSMMDGSTDAIVYYCTEERENQDSEWQQVPNQYGEIWQLHNMRP